MAGKFIDAAGKVHDLEDIDRIKWVDRNGDVIYESEYKDTITYTQGGETKTKKLTETRRLLQFMDGFAAGDYSYMPTKIGDVFQGISLEMMTDSALYTVGKGAAVLTFGAVGGLIGSAGGLAGTAAGAGLGASIGAWLANAGADIYKFAQAYNEEPNTFWNRYVSSLKDIARGADSNLEPNATGWRRLLSEINVGTSYIGMGGKAAVYETWDDIVGTPEIGYVAANIFGNVTRAICAGVGGTMSYVVDQGLNDALREGTRIVGITNDVALAAEVGAMYGLVAGGTAWGFNKLNLANKFGFEKLEKVSPFLGNPLANGIDATSAQLLYDFIQDRIDPTEESKDISDYGLNAAMALVTGWSMSALPVMWSKIKPKQLADATRNMDAPKPSDTPTVKEAVENTVILEEAKPEIKTVKDDGLTHGKFQYTAEQLEKFNKQRIPRQYREQARATETEMIEELARVNVEELYKATGKEVERVNPEAELNYLKRKMFNNFNALNTDEKAGLIYRMGFESESAFFTETPLADLYNLNKTVGDIYNVPIYNPNMPVLSVQQNTDIASNALKMINNGMQPETAIYIAYCKIAKVAPDESEVSRILATMPETVRTFDESSSVMAKVRDFINANEKEAFDYVFTNYDKLYPHRTRKPQGKRKSKVQIVQEAIEGVDVMEGAKNNKFKRK